MQQRLALLIARGIGRTYTPIGALSSVPRLAVVDTIGFLCFMSAPSRSENGWDGGARELRKLFLVDESMQLLCVSWSRPPSEPMPKLHVGKPLCVLDCKFEFTHTDPWPRSVSMRGGGEALLIDQVVHHVTAESAGPTPTRLVTKIPGQPRVSSASSARSPSNHGFAHLHARFDELNAKQGLMTDLLSKFAAIAMELLHGRLLPSPASPRPLLAPSCMAAIQNASRATLHEAVLALLHVHNGLTPGQIITGLLAQPTVFAQRTGSSEIYMHRHSLELDMFNALDTLAQQFVVYIGSTGAYYPL